LSNVPFVSLDGRAKDKHAPAPEVKRGDDPLALCRRWQADFIESRQPKHLPPGREILSAKRLDGAGRGQQSASQ
jgi:hypothetical protein